MKTFLRFVFTSSVLLIASPLVVASSDAADIQALKRQVEALQERVVALESTRTFTAFMPDFAERFHVMHRAGETGDWAVAAHELEEMKRLSELSVAVDPDKGKLMQGMMSLSFETLEKAIEHGNQKKFQQALEQTINTCNSCHTATGSPFIQVTLNAPDSLNMRHPHVLTERKISGGHRHGMPAQMSKEMMKKHQDMSGGQEHDDSEKPHDESENHHDDKPEQSN